MRTPGTCYCYDCKNTFPSVDAAKAHKCGRRAFAGMVAAAESRLPFSLVLPIRTVSEANVHGKMREKFRRVKEQRGLSRILVASHVAADIPGLPLIVKLTRMGVRLLDDDNLRGALKAVRDGVCDGLGLADDSDIRIAWEYGQTKSKEYNVVVEFTRKQG